MDFNMTPMFPPGTMSLAELLGLDPAFGLDKPFDLSETPQDSETSEDSGKTDTKKAKGPPTFTDAQLAALAKLGNPQAGQENVRPPGAVAPSRPQMLPMTQAQLPQVAAPGGTRPTLAQLIYGGR